jgi:diguanylate cyclase (GGDEF)-like protein
MAGTLRRWRVIRRAERWGNEVTDDRRELTGDQGGTSPSPAAIACEWAQAIADTAYVPMAFSDKLACLQDLTERLLRALSGPSVDTQSASKVGTQLVASGFTGAQSLPQTFEVLGRTLPTSCRQIIELLGALATGYAWALRDLVLNQQEEVRKALSLAWQNVERELRTSQAKSRETFDSSTDIRLLEQRFKHQTLHDLQTGLANRQYLLTHLEKMLAQLEPPDVITLMHLDLDGFSAVNDGLGHHVGNQLLDVAARRLERAVEHQQAMVARLGSDEYAILIVSGDSVIDVGTVAEAINTELAEPFYVDEIGVATTATIGVRQCRAGETTTHDELMRAANSTLRRLRGQGMGQWVSFDPGIDAVERAKLRLAAAMPGALETGELSVTYQPVVTLDERLVMGLEATLSWQHPQLGMLSNEQCVQAAQRTGVVHAVGEWLLRTAAEQAVCWKECFGEGMPPVVVNLMPAQAQDQDLVARVSAVLKQTSLKPADLELRAPVAAVRMATGEFNGEGGVQAEDNLRVLAELDVRTGLYDFAGGVGELRCLADLPLRVVRIAQPISEQVANDPSRILSQAAQAFVHIVRGAGIDVVGFPVDSAEQAACWPWIGANWAVGALFGQPSSPEDIELRMRRVSRDQHQWHS